MNRAQKAESIETLKGVFADAGAVVVTHYMGLTVAEMTDLRLRLRKEGAQIKVVKNTLAQKALNGSVGEAGDALFTGPVAIAYAPDPVSAAKVVTQYAKDNDKFTVVGGLMGKDVLDQNAIKALATLPAPEKPSVNPSQEAVEREEKRKALVKILAEIEKRINEENARPKKRYISPATREAVYAVYYDGLRRKIEQRGTSNFPEAAGRKLYGELTM